MIPDTARARVLDLVDERFDATVDALAELVALPSISGTDAENEAIAHMARSFAAIGLDVDHWQIPLDETMSRPDFPGVEVERREAWGAVGVLRGARTRSTRASRATAPPAGCSAAARAT
jgi:acetylornithine deacetylase